MKLKIHNTTYVFLLLAFLAGYFEYMFLFLLIIFVHESGHYFFGKLINFKYSEIIIYPFGGITKYNEDLNINTNKELFVLLGGITFQLIFYLLILILYNNMFITNHVFNIIKKINFLLISFNFMPIIPLDGGKLLNILLDKIFPYKVSNLIAIIISIIFILYFILFNKTLFALILTIFLIKCIIIEFYNIKYKYNKFLLERYLNEYNFKKIRITNNINLFKRDYAHIINNEFEKNFLSKIFDRSK